MGYAAKDTISLFGSVIRVLVVLVMENRGVQKKP